MKLESVLNGEVELVNKTRKWKCKKNKGKIAWIKSGSGSKIKCRRIMRFSTGLASLSTLSIVELSNRVQEL